MPVSMMRSGLIEPDQFLHGNDVLRVLDDRAAKRRETRNTAGGWRFMKEAASACRLVLGHQHEYVL